MFGVIRKISPYTNRKAWKVQIEVDDCNVPDSWKTDPWAIQEIPVDVVGIEVKTAILSDKEE